MLNTGDYRRVFQAPDHHILRERRLLRRSLLTLLSLITVCSALAAGPRPDKILIAQASPGGLPASSILPSGQQIKYQVLVASNLDDRQATNLQSQLVKDGFTPVEKVDAGNGVFNILIGQYDTPKQAEELMNELKQNSYLPEKVQSTADRSSHQRTVSTAEKGRVHRVQVFEFESRAKADEAKAQLEKDDYFPVEVVSMEGRFRVLLGNFTTREEAVKLVEMMHRDGYPNPQVVEMASDQDTPRGAVAQVKADLPAEAESFTRESQDRLQRCVELQIKAEAGIASAEELRELQQVLKGLTPEERQLVDKTKSARQWKEAQVRELHHKFNVAIQQERFEDAQKIVADAVNIAPDHALTDSMKTILTKFNDLRNSKKSDPQRIRDLETEAETAMINRDYATAIARYNEILQQDPNHANAKAQLEKAEAMRKSEQDANGGTGTASASLGNNKIIVWGGAGALALVLLVFTVVLYQNSRREKELIRHVQELTSHTATPADQSSELFSQNLGQSPVLPSAPPPPQGQSGSAPLPGLEENLFPQLNASSQGALKDTDRIPSTPPPPPVTAATPETREKPVTESDMVMISDLFDMNKMPRTAPAPPAAPASSESSSLQEAETLRIPELSLQGLEGSESKGTSGINLPGFDIDELLKKPFPGSASESEEEVMDQPTARIEDIAVIPPPSPRRPSEPPVAIPPSADGTAAEPVPAPEHETPIPDVPQAAPADLAPTQPLTPVTVEPVVTPVPAAAALFTQDFEQENVGDQPVGWSGEYDYATLTVDDRSPARNSSKCLRFEKRSGAGSANYVCHFPKASGHLIVEFDIRCDDKNKYLLGFYVEKDEDFKQSVHTIVHRVDSKSQPTLRIQGEPIPYEFGTWRRVKYDVNLLLGVVNAYVDDAQVVKDAKLATVPAYLNTLSIRDNLATTGLLYLDNIRITRA